MARIKYKSLEEALNDIDNRKIDNSKVPRQLIDISGGVFGRLEVIKYAGVDSSNKSAVWACKCNCQENIFVLVRSYQLRRGDTKSCGCLSSEVTSARRTSHALSGTAEYVMWRNIMNRCTVGTNPQYNDYGGRGIMICKRWNTKEGGSFENFLEDMGKRPSKSHSIDRINVDGNYEPSNCRWTDSSVQNHNQRLKKNNSTGFRGVSETKYGTYEASVAKEGFRFRKSGFKTAESAAAWYDFHAKILYGETANINGVKVEKFEGVENGL